MTNNQLANIEFKLEWTSPFATHNDIYYVENVDPLIDKLPLGFGQKISHLNVGQSYSQTFQAKDILDEGFSTNKVVPFEADLFNSHFKGQHSPPMLYRFYPSAIAWQGINTFETDFTPFRLISSNSDNMIADRNHPLAKYYLCLTATKIKKLSPSKDHQHRKRNINKLITSKGPGMQVPFEYGDPIFFQQYPFTIINEGNKKPEELLQTKLDTNTAEQVSKLYSQLLPKHSKVLDLLSSQSSYLEEDYETGLLAGIGANEEALSKNQRLDTYQVQDLNNDVILPFEDNSFDDAICTASISCLTDPLKIMREVARVVNSGGKFIITFSNQPSSTQNINLWGQLHPFERVQLVLEYFRQEELFKELNTFSKREVLPTENGKPPNKKYLLNGIYSIWGVVK